MTPQAAVVFVSDRVWNVGVVGEARTSIVKIAVTPGSSISEQLNEVHRALAVKGVVPGRSILALPSAWCLNARLTVNETERRNPRTLLFALEEQLPIAAEDVVADFIDGGENVMGVCASRSKVASVVQAMQACGWIIAAVCPAPLLVLSQLLEKSVDAPAFDAFLTCEGNQWVLLRMSGEFPISWHLLPVNLQDLQQLLQMLLVQSNAPIRLLACAVSSDICDALMMTPDLTVTPAVDCHFDDAATRAAESILGGHRLIPIDLSLDGARRTLARGIRRSLTVAAASAAACMLMLLAAFSIASWRLDRQIEVLRDEQSGLFHRVVTDSHRQAPRQVERYLASEAQRVSGGDRSGDGRLSTGAMQMLDDLFSRLPPQVPLQLSQLHIESDRAELAGQVSTQEDAGRVASALGADGKFAVQPPQTAVGRVANVTFTLQVQRNSAHLAAASQLDNSNGEP